MMYSTAPTQHHTRAHEWIVRVIKNQWKSVAPISFAKIHPGSHSYARV